MNTRGLERDQWCDMGYQNFNFNFIIVESKTALLQLPKSLFFQNEVLHGFNINF